MEFDNIANIVMAKKVGWASGPSKSEMALPLFTPPPLGRGELNVLKNRNAIVSQELL